MIFKQTSVKSIFSLALVGKPDVLDFLKTQSILEKYTFLSKSRYEFEKEEFDYFINRLKYYIKESFQNNIFIACSVESLFDDYHSIEGQQNGKLKENIVDKKIEFDKKTLAFYEAMNSLMEPVKPYRESQMTFEYQGKKHSRYIYAFVENMLNWEKELSHYDYMKSPEVFIKKAKFVKETGLVESILKTILDKNIDELLDLQFFQNEQREDCDPNENLHSELAIKFGFYGQKDFNLAELKMTIHPEDQIILPTP